MVGRAAMLLAALLTGCTTTSSEECSDEASCETAPRCASLDEAEVRENTPAGVARVDEAAADLTLVVTNSSRATERVIVRAGGQLLLDALLPPAADYCGHSPVFSWSYALPQQGLPLAVAAADQSLTLTLTPGDRRWLTVMTQEEFPLYARLTDEAPSFG